MIFYKEFAWTFMPKTPQGGWWVRSWEGAAGNSPSRRSLHTRLRATSFVAFGLPGFLQSDALHPPTLNHPRGFTSTAPSSRRPAPELLSCAPSGCATASSTAVNVAWSLLSLIASTPGTGNELSEAGGRSRAVKSPRASHWSDYTTLYTN